mmetsp:Transcript_17194/g.49198  ORF Transcript_17194/g.49198 Transcript_17194/m.49198 type:complete len:327 (+) Transcript_17194:153-1133(+)
MDYLTVTFLPGAKLGMSVIDNAESGLPPLGNTVVESVEQSGAARSGGVQAGDFVVSVNDQYVAFDRNIEVVQLLQSIIASQQQIHICFARANPYDWNKIRSSSEAPIKEGLVGKLHQGIFRKWNTRQFKLTRETLSYLADGVLRGKFALGREASRARVAAGYTNQQGVFELRCGEKDFVLQTNSALERNKWLHALECAFERAFDKALPGMVASTTTSSLRPQSMPASSQSPPQALDERYLEMGRAALQGANGGGFGGAPSREASGAAHEAAGDVTYKILSLSRVQAAAGPDTRVSLADLCDPTAIKPALTDYDFALEQRVLSSASS